MSQKKTSMEKWGTRVGVILAVTGSAVGLGNFLRFPGQAAQHGGGAFIIPYLCAFVLLGLPIAWVEWSLGRYGGKHGYNSLPGVFRSVWKSKAAPFVGVLGLLIPVAIYMYYVYVEAWCLGYAWYYATGAMPDTKDAGAFNTFFESFVGINEDGAAFSGKSTAILLFVLLCFALNFFLIYRGLAKGIEWFCRWAMPALILCAVIVLVRVLTLGTPDPENKPDQSMLNGMGYMWNPVQDANALAPGDKAVQDLIIRTAADAAEVTMTGEKLTGFKVIDAKGVAWALAKAGWSKIKPETKETKNETKKKDDTPRAPSEGSWKLNKNGTTIHVLNGVGSIKRAVEVEKEVEESLSKLTMLFPRGVAKVVMEGQKFDTIQFQDAAEFEKALKITLWSNENSEDKKTWSNNATKLTLQLNDTKATVHAPGFWDTLANADTWLAAAGQIFFSLSVGFGIIITYSSYLKAKDDVALSSLTACAGNGFCEVALGGLIVIPAAFVFLGFEFVQNPPGTFGMGFVTLPNVFAHMHAGQFFGFLFFFLLFLAAVTSSLSMLQPAIALLEEGLGLTRKASVAILGFVTLIGCLFIMYHSKGLLAMDTVDFWAGSFCIYILATIEVILFAWVLGMEKGMAEMQEGAQIRIPGFVRILIKWVAPIYLLTIFGFWLADNLLGDSARLSAIRDNPVVQYSIGLIAIVAILFLFLIAQSVKRWSQNEAEAQTKEVTS